MVKINGKFVRYDKFGEKIALKLCEGWTVTLQISDRFGNGELLFDKFDCCTAVVAVEELKVEDIVTVEYNKLAVVERLYE